MRKRGANFKTVWGSFGVSIAIVGAFIFGVPRLMDANLVVGITPPPWEKAEVVYIEPGVCSVGNGIMALHVAEDGQQYFVFYITGEENPFVLYHAEENVIYIDYERDKEFDKKGQPGEEGIPEGPCEAMEEVNKVKPIEQI